MLFNWWWLDIGISCLVFLALFLFILITQRKTRERLQAQEKVKALCLQYPSNKNLEKLLKIKQQALEEEVQDNAA